jgi:hypothetical protein
MAKLKSPRAFPPSRLSSGQGRTAAENRKSLSDWAAEWFSVGIGQAAQGRFLTVGDRFSLIKE